MGLDATKTVFWVSDKWRLKPDTLATETSQKIEISPIARLDMNLSNKQITKGADQTARMCRLVCIFVAHKPPKTGFLMSRSIYFC